MARRTCRGDSAAPAPGTPAHKRTLLSNSTQHNKLGGRSTAHLLDLGAARIRRDGQDLIQLFRLLRARPASANFAEPASGRTLSRGRTSSRALRWQALMAERAEDPSERSCASRAAAAHTCSKSDAASTYRPSACDKQAHRAVQLIAARAARGNSGGRARAPGRGRRASSVP